MVITGRDSGFEIEVKPATDTVTEQCARLHKRLFDSWEKRRDAAVGEVERSEAVHIFGTDKMGTADLFRLFMGKGPEEPAHVEWVNDSSANVVFASGVVLLSRALIISRRRIGLGRRVVVLPRLIQEEADNGDSTEQSEANIFHARLMSFG